MESLLFRPNVEILKLFRGTTAESFIMFFLLTLDLLEFLHLSKFSASSECVCTSNTCIVGLKVTWNYYNYWLSKSIYLWRYENKIDIYLVGFLDAEAVIVEVLPLHDAVSPARRVLRVHRHDGVRMSKVRPRVRPTQDWPGPQARPLLM